MESPWEIRFTKIVKNALVRGAPMSLRSSAVAHLCKPLLMVRKIDQKQAHIYTVNQSSTRVAIIFNGKRIVSSTNGVKTGYPQAKKMKWTLILQYTKQF